MNFLKKTSFSYAILPIIFYANGTFFWKPEYLYQVRKEVADIKNR